MFEIKKYITLYKKYEEQILYLIFGFLTTIIYLGLYKIFLDMNVQYLWSATYAFIVAVLFAFVTNRHIVFKKGNNVVKEIILFFAARIITQAINNIGLIIFIEFIGVGEFISQVILSIIVVILNYIFSKYAIFI